MTTVEELRKRVLNVCFDTSAIEDIATLIAAARWEGAEWAKETIRENSGFLAKGNNVASDDRFDEIPLRNTGMFVAVAVCDCYVIPASDLAAAHQEGR